MSGNSVLWKKRLVDLDLNSAHQKYTDSIAPVFEKLDDDLALELRHKINNAMYEVEQAQIRRNHSDAMAMAYSF